MSLFGGAPTLASTSSLFGGLNNNTSSQPQQTNSLFGSFGGGNNNTSNSQFQQQGNAFGAFGAPQQSSNNNATSTQGIQTTNAFGGAMRPQSGLFGQNMSNQQQGFGGSTFGATQQQSTMQGRPGSMLWQPGQSMSPREKSIPEQMQLILEKWSPESGSCQFQHYFYNHVQAEAVPYYAPAPGEDESEWEEALAKKPDEGAIPVLCRGFSALGNRLRVQVQSVSSLQQRLHEINNSLAAMLQNHDLEISVRIVDAKRRHVALSQRCLQLATKVQLLRNRGYAMDSAEEELRQKLLELEKRAFDPLLSGRQEEIWARMVGIRARARMLQEEMEKSGNKDTRNPQDGLSDEVLPKVKKLLGDYDSQISHLQQEMDEIRKEYEVWESSASAQPSASK